MRSWSRGETLCNASDLRIDLHQAALVGTIDSGFLSQPLATVIATKALHVGSTSSNESKSAASSVLSSLRERFPHVVDTAALTTDNLDPSLVQRPENETTMINLLSADVSARVQGLHALMEPYLSDPSRVSDEEKGNLKTAILTRLSDTEAQVLEALYKTPEHKHLIASTCSGKEIIEAVRPVFVADAINVDVVVAHLDFVTNCLIKVQPEVSRAVFEEILFPVMLPSQSRALPAEAWKVIASSELAKEDVIVKALDGVDIASPLDISARIARAISDTAFLVNQFGSNLSSSRLLALLIANHMVSKSDPATAVQFIRALSPHLRGQQLHDIGDALEPLSEDLSSTIFTRPKAARTTQRAVVAFFAALTRVQRTGDSFGLSTSTFAYKTLAEDLYIWSNSSILPLDLSKALLRSLFAQLGQDALVFFASVWTSTRPAGLRASALKHALAYIRAHSDLQGGIDFQSIIPAILIALQDGDKSVRTSGVAVLQAVLDVSKSSDNVYSLDTIYGDRSSEYRGLI